MTLLPNPAPEAESLVRFESTPEEEYVAILRSYLSEEQKLRVRLLVEKLCCMEGIIPTMRYCDILQSQLTAFQKSSALERLEMVYADRRWA